LALGVGLGFSVISPWGDKGLSASTFKIAGGIYLIAVAMLASTVGGYLTGRLRDRWAGVHTDEVYFRDTAHGLLAWALATVLGATVLGAATTHILAGAASGSIPAAGAAAAAGLGSPVDLYVDTLLRADAPAAASRPTEDLNSMRAEIGRVIGIASRGGDVTQSRRANIARLVSARTGLDQAEAEQRVTNVITQVKSTADETRKATAKLALWLVASMFAGALAASLAAVEGGILRDSKWYEPGWRRGENRA
jgi:hypothetical protein